MALHTKNIPIKCGARKFLCSTFANFKECVVWKVFGNHVVVIVVAIVEHLFPPLVHLFLHIFHCCMSQCHFLDASWNHPNLSHIPHFVYESVFNLATWSKFCHLSFDNNIFLPMPILKIGHDFGFKWKTLNIHNTCSFLDKPMTIDTNCILFFAATNSCVEGA